jgi:hypothetical protein
VKFSRLACPTQAAVPGVFGNGLRNAPLDTTRRLPDFACLDKCNKHVYNPGDSLTESTATPLRAECRNRESPFHGDLHPYPSIAVAMRQEGKALLEKKLTQGSPAV